MKHQLGHFTDGQALKRLPHEMTHKYSFPFVYIDRQFDTEPCSSIVLIVKYSLTCETKLMWERSLLG